MSDDEKDVKVYVTKYCLTRGIIECTVKDWCLDTEPDGSMVKVEWPGGLNGVTCFFGMDWWRNKEDAKKRHREMVVNKLKALRTKSQKLQKWLNENGD